MFKKTLIYVGGPTASGKTDLGVQLAKNFKTEIISCDSRQFYKEMTIGTLIPSMKERKGVIHHFIQHKSIFENYNAWDFAEDTNSLLKKLFKNKEIVIMLGGSGLYAKSVINGLDYFPKVPLSVKNKIEKIYRQNGIESLKNMLSNVDPIYYKKVDQNNPRRLIRALEVHETTGEPYSSFLNKKTKKKSFETKTIIIDLPKEILHQRIKSRLKIMLDHGLEKEAVKLYQHKENNAMQTIGYREWFDFFDKKISREQVENEIIKNTNRYAKKQLTWFRKNFKDKFVNEIKIQSIINDLF
jgi:tRNA dimethylallyltransferase